MDGQRADDLSKDMKKRKRNIEEERTSHRKERLRKTVINLDDPPVTMTKSKNTVCVFLRHGQVFATAHIFRKIFSPEKLAHLSLLILAESNFWVEKKDRRCGTLRKYFIAGKWTEQGHCRPGIDQVYWAKPGGDLSNFQSPELLPLIQEIGTIASDILCNYRPELVLPMLQAGYSSVFNLFHLFLAPLGTTKPHRDPNDYIAFIFPMKMDDDAQGGFSLPFIRFKLNVGDCILFDSDLLDHGVLEYIGEQDDRHVGVLLIHKTFMRIHQVI
jgi:hypothetical protein